MHPPWPSRCADTLFSTTCLSKPSNETRGEDFSSIPYSYAMNLDLDILIVLEVLGYIVNLTQFIKCYEDTYLPLAVYWGCEQLHFPEVHFTQNFPHYFSHLPAIPDISIIFCRRGLCRRPGPAGFRPINQSFA